MADKGEKTHGDLLRSLMAIDFDRQYFDLHRKLVRNSSRKDTGNNEKMFQSIPTHFPKVFTYNAKEKFFLHSEALNGITVQLKVALLYGDVEIILSIKLNDQWIGGPFPKLAREAAQLRDPDFEYTPRSPKLPFGDIQELELIVRFGLAIFEELRKSLLLSGD